MEQKIISNKALENKITYGLCAMFLASLLGMIFVIRPLDNTVGGGDLGWIAFSIGAVLGACQGFMLINRRLIEASEKAEKAMLLLFCAVSVGFLAATFAGCTNYHFAHTPRTYQAPIIGKWRSGGKSNSFFLYVIVMQRKEQVVVSEKMWDKSVKGQSIKVKVYDGLLGFPIIEL